MKEFDSRNVFKNIRHLARVYAIDSAQSTLELLVRWLRRVIGSIARDIRREGREEPSFRCPGDTIDNLGWGLKRDGRDGQRGDGAWGKGRDQRVGKEVEPYADDLRELAPYEDGENTN